MFLQLESDPYRAGTGRQNKAQERLGLLAAEMGSFMQAHAGDVERLIWLNLT